MMWAERAIEACRRKGLFSDERAHAYTRGRQIDEVIIGSMTALTDFEGDIAFTRGPIRGYPYYALLKKGSALFVLIGRNGDDPHVYGRHIHLTTDFKSFVSTGPFVGEKWKQRMTETARTIFNTLAEEK